ncbi:solute carrier family 22 member 5-like [Tropilaelaps mercedesae]|uniref:Solute carrier family 22 member 5-like n=1 Tax=Tropilaelaps mercedesae TaxID=418985 RepID=A0A1V9XGE3_9ACAR|nr:solute carrier family 22 member 5-like [Tropilaelaps mercedesae]
MEDLLDPPGRWHAPVLIVNAFRNVVFAHIVMSISFVAPKQDYWCKPPDGMDKDTWIASYQGHDHKCGLPPNSTQGSVCTEWEFDTSEYSRTILQEFNLVCHSHWMVALTQSVFMFGVMIGHLTFSSFSDWFGRRPGLIICSVVILLGNSAIALAPTFVLYVAARFFAAVGHGGMHTVPLTLAIECVGPSKRALCTMSQEFGWIFGITILPVFTYFIRDWRFLIGVVTLPEIAILLLTLCLDESPKWLLCRGRYEQVSRLLQRIARLNRRRLNDDDIPLIIEKARQKLRLEQREAGQKGIIFDLFQSCRIAVMTLSGYIQFAIVVLAYFHLMYYIVDVGSNPYVNLVLTGLFELPLIPLGYVLIRNVRRRTLYTWLYVPSIVLLSTLLVIPDEWSITRGIVASLAKLGVQLIFSLLCVHITECYPTPVRAVALGSSLMASRFGAIVAPFIDEVSRTGPEWWWMPTCIDVTTCAIGLLLSTLFPETLNLQLPNTFGDTKAILSRSRRNSRTGAAAGSGTAAGSTRPLASSQDVHAEFENGTGADWGFGGRARKTGANLSPGHWARSPALERTRLYGEDRPRTKMPNTRKDNEGRSEPPQHREQQKKKTTPKKDHRNGILRDATA